MDTNDQNTPETLLALTPSQGAIAPSDDQILHNLGQQYQQESELGKSVYVGLALILYKARAINCRRGPHSLWFRWLARYAPDLNRKQADRLANIIEFFTSGDPDRLSEFDKLVEFFRLTALYRLAVSTAPAEARAQAIEDARSKKMVTPARAQELIERFTVPALPAPDSDTADTQERKKKPQTIEVDGGKVIVRSADGDALKVLKAAVKQLERLGA